MCRLSWNLGASTSWNPQDLSRPVMGLLWDYWMMWLHYLMTLRQLMKLHGLICNRQSSYKQHVENLIVTLYQAQLCDVWNPMNTTNYATPRIPNYTWFRNKNSSEFRNRFLTDNNSQCGAYPTGRARQVYLLLSTEIQLHCSNCGGYVTSKDSRRRSREVNTNVA